MRGHGVADVTLTIPETKIAPLPYRTGSGAIIYPTGTIRGVWTFQEIQNAADYGARIVKVNKCYGSTRAKNFYAPFVEKIYAARLAAETDAEKLMLKLLLNNLYGRLAISGGVTRNRKGTLQLYPIRFPLPEFTNYLHAAYVTSYGRLQLQNYLRRVPADDLIYCDTDSMIFFNKTAAPPFPVSRDIGKMKLEGRANRCFTYAPKMYVFGFHAKAKGVRRKYAVEFIRKGSAAVETPFRIRECCDFLETKTGAEKIPSVWRIVEKHAVTKYDKKQLLTNGQFIPYQLQQFRRRQTQTGSGTV